MTPEQSKQLSQLIYAFGSASESLGACEGSYGWNALNATRERAEEALRTFINRLGPKP